jgi:tetratricopeptide (TPR) repeat protein
MSLQEGQGAMRRLAHLFSRIETVARRVGTFVFYLPLMVRIGSLSVWQRDGSRTQAISLCERKRRNRPFAPVPYRILVDLHIADGNHAKVAELCEDLVLLGHGSAALAKKQAYALCHLERFHEAADVLEAALDPDAPDAWMLECLGNCYFTLAEYLLARQAYLRCLDLAVGAEVRTRVQDLVRQVDALLGYRSGEADEEGRG